MFKVNIKIDNKDKIYFLTAFDKENLLPSYSSLATIDTMSKDIGKTKKFIIHIIKKPNQDIEMNNYYFNIRSISDE